ncbi:DeoR/GlpR family DNA-binding transcription regulator [Bacillus fonticola]|uniref:DeoR/GlpR family DNA-binding transcription regulator n=1 Tax=Bacillus fonticola TaxID=2728853 RepID=UPI0014737948|nr:DeoR/GlpR family DNA-binding transcription regulator [Bacillus fonticola]
MLTPERHARILELLQANEVVRLQQFVDATTSSESTIRRDLAQLEEERKLKRVHGGAALLKGKRDEQTVAQKSTKNLQEKRKIAQLAAQSVQPGDCLYLDAGTTTYEMIPFLTVEDLVVVTNGISLVNTLLEQGVQTYLLGGAVKPNTHALIGRGALTSMQSYRFDKAFLGTNGIHLQHGCTTPDPEEAMIKEQAIALAGEAYVLADPSKFHEVSFARFASLEEVRIITCEEKEIDLSSFQQHSKLEVVTS